MVSTPEAISEMAFFRLIPPAQTMDRGSLVCGRQRPRYGHFGEQQRPPGSDDGSSASEAAADRRATFGSTSDSATSQASSVTSSRAK